MSALTRDELLAAMRAARDAKELTIGTCIEIMAETQTEEEKAYCQAARDSDKTREGELEVDDPSIASLGDDNGAYVLAWLWIEGPEVEDEGDEE